MTDMPCVISISKKTIVRKRHTCVSKCAISGQYNTLLVINLLRILLTFICINQYCLDAILTLSVSGCDSLVHPLRPGFEAFLHRLLRCAIRFQRKGACNCAPGFHKDGERTCCYNARD